MQSIFETIAAKQLIGMRLPMSLANNRVVALWQGFMPRRHEITNRLNSDLISMQVYHSPFDVHKFGPQTMFDKWAAVEVSNQETIPEGMEAFTLPGGLYAVFHHIGPASSGPAVFGYIFGTWLPGSGYVIDDRPHFEVLGAAYKNNDPTSEEDIWIPVRKAV